MVGNPFLKRSNLFAQNMKLNSLMWYVELTKSQNKQDNTTIEYHYRADMFAAAIEQQLQELNVRFSEQSKELLSLCADLGPRDNSFSIFKIFMLAENFYPADLVI
jgi:oligoendopeptidase F